MTNNGCKTDGKCFMLSIPRKKFSICHTRGNIKLSFYFVHKNDVIQLLEEEMTKIYASKIKGKKEGIFFTQVAHKMLFS